MSAAPEGVVELFGLCGAGKSTVLARAVPGVAQRSMPDDEGFAFPVVPSGAAAIAWGLTIAAVSARTEPIATARFLSRREGWWLPMKLGYRMAGMRKRAARGLRSVVVDGGLLQPFVSFEVETNVHGGAVPLRALLSAVDAPAAAVYVRVSAATAMARWLGRERDAGRERPRDGAAERFEAAHARCEELLVSCRERGIPVLEVENEEMPDDAEAARLREFLRTHRARVTEAAA